MAKPSPKLDLAMQAVVDDLGITREEAGQMIRAGLEQAAIGARIYGMFLSGEVRERDARAPTSR